MGFGGGKTSDVDQVWTQTIHQVSKDNARAKGLLTSSNLVAVLGSTAVIECPNASTSRYIQENLAESMRTSLSGLLGSDVTVAISVNTGMVSSADAADLTTADHQLIGTATDPIAERPSPVADAAIAARQSVEDDQVVDLRDRPRLGEHRSAAPEPTDRHSIAPLRKDSRTQSIAGGRPPNQHGSRLNDRYTFDTFVIGESNRFAHAAAIAAAERPAVAYNPLFIYGGSGLGKTHLLHAIGHLTRELRPEAVVRYVSSEDFTNEFINMVQHKSNKGFRDTYRSVDLLLIDDIQFLTNKEQTQVEFFHTFNHLYNNYKQIVITSDQPPRELHEFEVRIRSRFESGLLTDVQPPDLETRIAILRKKMASERTHVDPAVLSFIASRIVSNIRELEGALTRVIAFAQLNRCQADEALAQTVLRDIGADHGPTEVTPTLIISETAAFYGIGVDDLTGPQRHRQFAQARQIAMYICRELTDLSLPRIGQVFGGRDHTTVMYADKKVRKQLADDHQIYQQVTNLTRQIKSSAARGTGRP